MSKITVHLADRSDVVVIPRATEIKLFNEWLLVLREETIVFAMPTSRVDYAIEE